MCGGRPKNAELIHDAIRAVADILNRDIGERWGDLLSVSRTLIERKAAFTRRNYV